MRRRVVMIGVPLAVVVVTICLLGYRRLSPNPFAPMQPFVTYEATYFVPPNASQDEPNIQTWAWLSPRSRDQLPAFSKWLSEKQGWTMISNGTWFMATRGRDDDKSSSLILPAEEMSVSPDEHNQMLLIYARHVAPETSIIYSHLYKNLDYNSPRPSRP